MPDTVAHHFNCRSCGYDLYTTPLDGKCPECGKPVPKIKSLENAKNPRRVNSQHLTRIRKAKRALWLWWPVTVIFLAIVVGSFWYTVPKWLRILSWAMTISCLIGLAEIWIEIKYHTGKMVPEGDSKTKSHETPE